MDQHPAANRLDTATIPSVAAGNLGILRRNFRRSNRVGFARVCADFENVARSAKGNCIRKGAAIITRSVSEASKEHARDAR